MFSTNSKFRRFAAIATAFFIIMLVIAPISVEAQSTDACKTLKEQGLKGVVNCIINILNSVMVLLVAGAVVFIAYGAFEMIASEEKRESGKQRIYHGIIGLFVMVSIWGFVNILNATFNLQGSVIRPTPLVPQSGSVSGDSSLADPNDPANFFGDH